MQGRHRVGFFFSPPLWPHPPAISGGTSPDPVLKNSKQKEESMAVFTCEKCGGQVDTRCKPKKCPQCGESGAMCKVEAPKPAKGKGKGK